MTSSRLELSPEYILFGNNAKYLGTYSIIFVKQNVQMSRIHAFMDRVLQYATDVLFFLDKYVTYKEKYLYCINEFKSHIFNDSILDIAYMS